MGILQYNQVPKMVHNHTYTPSHDIGDLTTEWAPLACEPRVGTGEDNTPLTFYVAKLNGAIDIVRIKSQSIIIDEAPTTDLSTAEAITWIDHGLFFIGGDRGVASNLRFGVYRDIGGNFINIPPNYQTSPIEAGGCTFDGVDVYLAYNREALISGIRRVAQCKTSDPAKQPKTLINSDTGWGSYSADHLRGIAYNGFGMWILFDDGGTFFLEYYRFSPGNAAAQDFKRISAHDITADLGGGQAAGLCFDGMYLYVGVN